ncbi:MAG: hypothetical protein ACJZ5B_09000 [Candidatus Poseidoniaceae archaeon]
MLVNKITAEKEVVENNIMLTNDKYTIIDGQYRLRAKANANDNGGRNILTAFHNRISTVVVIVQLMFEIENNKLVNLKQLIQEFNRTSSQLKDNLRQLEDKLGVKRGEKLSDGFPEYNEMNNGPMKIVHRNIIGTDGERILRSRGLLQEIGLVKVCDNVETSFELTEKAEIFRALRPLERYFEQLSEPKLISIQPNLPNYIDDETSLIIADIIFKLMPDEKQWTLHILEMISQASKELEFGWDSNDYAASEAENCVNGHCHARWTTKTGDTLFDKYMRRAIKQKKRSPKSHAADRLEKFINGALGSLLSRMKELGFIIPIRVGNTKNFRITSLGEQVLDRYSEQEMKI